MKTNRNIVPTEQGLLAGNILYQGYADIKKTKKTVLLLFPGSIGPGLQITNALFFKFSVSELTAYASGGSIFISSFSKKCVPDHCCQSWLQRKGIHSENNFHHYR